MPEISEAGSRSPPCVATKAIGAAGSVAGPPRLSGSAEPLVKAGRTVRRGWRTTIVGNSYWQQPSNQSASMSRPARQAREAGTAQDLFQRHPLPQKKAKHPNRPGGAPNTNRCSGTGGGAGPRRLSGPGERTRRKHECADERSAAAVRRAGRRTGHEEQGPAPPPGTRQKNRPATRHAPNKLNNAANHPARVKEAKQRHITRHAPEEPSLPIAIAPSMPLNGQRKDNSDR